MKPAEPFPLPSDRATHPAGTRRRPARRRALWITVGAVVAVPVLAMLWYFGVGYVNTLVAVSGHGTHGVFAPGYETCTSTVNSNHSRTKSCAWHGVFIPDGDASGMFDVTVSTSDGTRQAAWHVHLLPGTESAVVPATTGSRIRALIPAAAIIVVLLVSVSVLRPFFRRRKQRTTPRKPAPDATLDAKPDAPTEVPTDSGEIPGLTRY